MKRVAIAAFAIACGGSKPPATVTVLPAEASTSIARETTPTALPHQTPAPHGDAAPEIFAVGKVTVVHFFASWCAPCGKSIPELGALYAAHHGKVAVVAVGEDDDEPDMRSFVSQFQVSFTVLWDSGVSAKARAGRWRVNTMPSTFVVDKHAMVRFTHVGYRDGDAKTIDSEVQALLAEP